MNGITTEALTLEAVSKMQEKLIPLLLIPSSLDKLAHITARKTDEHNAYQIDMYANDLLLGVLRDRSFTGRVFTEESGWVDEFPSGNEVLICDPYDNTSLTLRGFREASIAATLGATNGEFMEAAIADLQMYRIIHCASPGGVTLWTKNEEGVWNTKLSHTSNVRDLSRAHIAVSLMKHKRRDQGNPDLGLIDQVGTLHAVDGAIMIARVALGELDAYVDSYIGQPAYELPAIELVRRAGGIVTDESGAELTHERILTVMHSDPASRIKIIAAANRDIHDQIMASRARRP
jgi:fructose-1,6-bisphosphatase/inositol monophosphatase family enzyme